MCERVMLCTERSSSGAWSSAMDFVMGWSGAYEPGSEGRPTWVTSW